jgi:hypothetical protein
VIAYSSRPPDIPQERYCNECVEVPEGTTHTMSDPVNGTFEMLLMPGFTYYFTVQKGEFRRVRQYTVPDTPGETVDLETAAGAPRPELTTLPNRTDLELGDNIPKIAMVEGSYEDMEPMFTALSFDFDEAGVDFDIYQGDVGNLLNDPELLDQYNLIIVTCGESWPGRNGQAENLRQWVRDGGSLYVDDFNYDFVEQPWPDFLSWYTDDSFDWDFSGGECGTPSSPSDGSGNCNNWSTYDFNGDASDVPDFAAWLELDEVNRGEPLFLYAAWDYIYELGEGEIGVDSEFGTGPNNEVYRLPKVWMYNVDSSTIPFSSSRAPATVSWPHYCGRVLYTVYHTHSSDSSGEGTNYQLLLQEKIMMYLIMEVQTCATDPGLY